MPDIEFLPAWYPRARRKKRVALVQFYMTVVLGLGLGLWMLLIRRNTVAAAASLDQISQQVVETRGELRQLDDQERLKDQLLAQQRVVDSLGLPVDVARLFHTVEQALPPEVSLTLFELRVDESQPVVSSLNVGKTIPMAPDRRLRVHFIGVAPSNGDIVRLLAGLTDVPFFEDVVTSLRDKTVSGHVMREFEISFWMSLNQPSER